MTSSRFDAVVLLHGLGGNRLLMLPLARALSSEHAQVVNWGYYSLHLPLAVHAARLAKLLRELDEQGAGPIHLVTHSMGGIISRLALSKHRPRAMGRFVMIAPPNQGSHLATFWGPWLGRVCPPLGELSEREGSLVRRLPSPAAIDVGVIAAATDVLVRRNNTHLPCQADHIVLPGWHTGILFRKETIAQTRHFLAHGRFERREQPAKAA